MPSILDSISSDELQAELKKRKEAEKNKKMVTVVCPICPKPLPNQAKTLLDLLGLPIECLLCKGTKKIQAELVESK